MHFDVFNGDADGILALLQLRLADPRESTLVTGVKRDIALLQQVDPARANSVTVLDISMEKNAGPLRSLLERRVPVTYVDHHRSGDIPDSPHLNAVIDTDPNVCTSLLVNQMLDGKYHRWAIAAAFGDNLKAAAHKACEEYDIDPSLAARLEELGIYINYNGYGRSVEDLHYNPADLYRHLQVFDDPEMLLSDNTSVFYKLRQAYNDDMEKAENASVLMDTAVCKVVQLEDAAWARRVSGVYGNLLANEAPDKAHAVLTKNLDGSYTVSVRAPINNKQGADAVCAEFPTGGGRAGAAGINALPAEMLDRFVDTLASQYTKKSA